MRVVHGLANFIRGSVRCMFPMATILLWIGLLLVPQGTDVVRAALERLSHLHSVGDLLYLWVASGLLGLSLWYSSRWLITAELPALRFSPPFSPFWRTWTPRVAGAFAPGLVVVVLVWPGNFPGVPGLYRFGTAAAFAALAAGLMVLFWRRSEWVSSLSGGTPGRNEDGSPGFLAISESLPPGTVGVIVWTLLLTGMLGLLCLQFALTVPRIIGAASVAAMALASVNLFGSFVLTWLPMRRALPPLAPWVLLWAILISPVTDNHGGAVRREAAAKEVTGPSVADAFEKWSTGLPADDHAPVYVVAAEGGGMRAAYWTAAALEALEPVIPDFRSHVFALSGVSGGSVGVAMWAASARGVMCPEPSAPVGSKVPRATDMLAADLVSPALAGLFYYDFAQRFVPIPISRLDRSRGIEEGMQRAGYRLPGRPFEMTLDEFYGNCPHLPELLLNATVVETGQRAILTRLDTRDFADAFRLSDPAPPKGGDTTGGGRLTLSNHTLAQITHHSARFPVISPPASIRTLPDDNGGFLAWARDLWWPDIRLRLVDGGYFENSGLLTAMEVLKQIQASPKRAHPRTIKLIIITSDAAVAALCKIRNGDEPCPRPDAERPQQWPSVLRWLHESVPVVEALYQVRDSRLHITAADATKIYDWQVIMLPMPQLEDGLTAPLGWALSAQVRRDLFCGAPKVVAVRYPASGVLASAKECKDDDHP